MRAGFRVPFQLLTILFLAGSALLLFFIVLAGSKSDGNLLNKWYYLAADTSGIEGAQYPISRWSSYGICGYEKGESVKHPGAFIECTSNKADYAFDPKRNFNVDESQLWDEFQTNKYYYETRFQYPFYLISLFFTIVALFLAIFGGAFRTAGFVSSVLILLTFVFVTIAASLTTAAYVQARNVFHNHGYDAALEPTLYGFAWAVMFMSFLNLIMSCLYTPRKNEGAGSYRPKQKGTPAGKRGGYRFGLNKKKTTQGGPVVDNKDASSFVRA